MDSSIRHALAVDTGFDRRLSYAICWLLSAACFFFNCSSTICPNYDTVTRAKGKRHALGSQNRLVGSRL